MSKVAFGYNRTIFYTAMCLGLFGIVLAGCDRVVTQEHPREISLQEGVTRTWLGSEFWANPMQDWQLNDGRIECITSGGDRNVYLLTHELSDKPGTIDMSVKHGRLDEKEPSDGWVGFKIGVRGEFEDYRDSAVRGQGLYAGIYTGGRLFIGKYDENIVKIDVPLDDIELRLSAFPSGETYTVTLTALSSTGTKLAEAVRDDISSDWLTGGVALVCSNGELKDQPDERPGIVYGNWGFQPGTNRGGNVRFWFADWKVAGSKVRIYPERKFGPVLFAQHTLSRGVMKMTAQMPPIGETDSQFVELEFKTAGKWKTIAKEKIDPLARTATFKIEDFDGSKDTPYRLVYELAGGDSPVTKHYYSGTIRKDPVDKKEIVVAGFTGNNDLGFPNHDFVQHVESHKPDLLFFSGDQIYEGVGGYSVQRSPIEKAAVDYLRKWYLYGWAYKELMRDIPVVSIPDDHDVYHGNIWGADGKATKEGLTGAAAQDTGGYKMPPEWVNMVQRTQTAHLPDAFDPREVQQGIGVYYCEMNYGGISFAIIEDRKFKSAPAALLPEAKIWNGFPRNADFDMVQNGDVPGAVLLGDRQLDFLEDWSADWTNNTWMKVVLSQTIFANVATLPAGETSDQAVPKLRILNADEYPPDDEPVSDLDTNSWPQTGRNEALKRMRKGFAFHIAGDQHLGSTIQYGVDDYHDAAYATCVPAVSNVWPRRWYPSRPGGNRKPGSPKYTGDHEDGFGNKMTVHAVSNPLFTGLKPSRLYDRATGYGIVKFKRNTRDITIECWPRLSDPEKYGAKQYPGWPITVRQADNYGREAYGYLPEIHVKGMTDPVVQVIDEGTEEIVYTIRIKGNRFKPKVFSDGSYTVRVGDPDSEMKTVKGMTVQPPGVGYLGIDF